MNSGFAEIVIKGLAVLGGFLAGYLIAAIVANSIDRLALGKRSPSFLHRGIRVLGGVALATLIAFLVFGNGHGWNVGGGSGGMNAPGSGTTEFVNFEIKPTPASAVPVVTPSRIPITILGGSDVRNERFYLLSDTGPALSLPELKEALPKLVTGDKPVIEIRYAQQNRLPSDHPAVLRLSKWLQDERKWTVLLPADGK